MILPSSREEGKNIKKRYAVFDHDGSLSELKGFEIKRRGELKLIKVFQEELFQHFLEGQSLDECYNAVGEVCDRWLDFLLSKGGGQTEEFIIEHISESKSMSDTLEEYGEKRSTSISTAKRLGEFLGQEVLADRGLNCKFVIGCKPEGTSTSDRAIPTAIFAAEEAVKRKYLRLWLKDSTLDDFDIRELIDWPYYIGRLSAAIQKIVTIPAAMQKIDNPVSRVKHPDWLGRKIKERDEAGQQRKIGAYFTVRGEGEGVEGEVGAKAKEVMDIEDMSGGGVGKQGRYTVVKRKKTAGVRISLVGDADDPIDDVEDITAEKRQRSDPASSAQSDTPMAVAEAKEGKVAQEEAVEGDEDGGVQNEFGSWLATRKTEWKALRERKKRQRHLPSSTNPTPAPSSLPSLNDGLRSYLQHSTTSLLTTPWQIIQITEDTTPGYFRFWVFLRPSTLLPVTVHTDRLILLNSRTRLDDDERHRRVERSLPRGRKVHQLYEMRVPEVEWREKEAEYLDTLRDESVEGMYETQVPLLFKLIRDVGCVCKVSTPPVRSTSFDADSLVYKTTTEVGYLDSPSLHRGFLYESHHSQKAGLGVLTLFLEGETDVLVVVINAYGGDVEAVKLAQLYKEEYNRMRREARQKESGRQRGAPPRC